MLARVSASALGMLGNSSVAGPDISSALPLNALRENLRLRGRQFCCSSPHTVEGTP